MHRCVITFALLCWWPLVLQAESASFDSNGVRIAYQDQGKGEAVVLVHGFCVDAQIQWGVPGIIRNLATAYRVIALDNRGHGKSGKPHDPDQYGDEMVRDLIRLLDHLQIKKAHFVGYSMGAFITCKLATMHPDRVLSATLGGAGWPRQELSSFADRLADSLDKEQSLAPLMILLTPEGKPQPTAAQIKQVNQFLMSFNDPKALAAVLRGNKKLLVTEEALKKNQVPMLCLIGDQDPLKTSVNAMKPVAANLRVVELQGADHMNAFSRPEFLKELRAFLAEHPANKNGK